MKFISTVFIFFGLLALSVGSVGCSKGDSPSDGDECQCGEGLACDAEGNCYCAVAGCCLSVEDCPANFVCDLERHQCQIATTDTDRDTETNPDGPDDEEDPTDGDTPTDTDGNELDDASETDGDDVEDGDDAPDGDADGDAESPDGDAPDGDASEGPSCPAPIGLDALEHPEYLSCFRPAILPDMTSSRDPQGGNSDFSVTNLWIDGDQKVVMDDAGAGCLYRIWLGSPADINGFRIRFYFDGAATPQIDTPIPDFFAGTTAPYLAPLVGETSESYYSYLPICYAQSLKITLSGNPKGFQFEYHRFPDSVGVTTFDPERDDPADLVEFFLSHLGESPHPSDGTSQPDFDITVPAGSTTDVVEDHTPHIVYGILIDLTPTDAELLDHAWLDIYWENKSTPDVSAPLGLFFGSGFGQVEYKSYLVGMTADGDWYSYFPMPYWEGMLIRIRNESAIDIQQMSVKLIFAPNPYAPGEMGHFHARYTEAIPTQTDADFAPLNAFGKGHVVGIAMAMESGPDAAIPALAYTKDFLYGDDRVYLDGMEGPQLHGTGTDNYFNGNSRFRTGAYETPLFSIWRNDNPTYQYSARRLMLSDMIPFSSSVRLNFEHGGTNEVNAKYRSVAYYYLSCLSALSPSDGVDFGTIQDEQLHSFGSQLESSFSQHQNVGCRYEGQADEDPIYDSGRGITGMASNKGYLEVTLQIDPENEGVRLIRRLDYSKSNQKATVYVDGQPVGSWYTPGRNQYLCWRDSAFDIPASFTATKATINLKFEYDGGEEWNVYRLWSYSILPPSPVNEGPGQVDAEGMSYSMIGLNVQLEWTTPPGVPPQYYHIFRSSNQVFDCNEVAQVGTATDTEWLDPQSLAAQSVYFYRIQAEDCTGTRGVCSLPFRVETGLPPYCFEGEDAYSSDESQPANNGEVQIRSGFSENEIIYFNATATYQKLVLITEVPYTGSYGIYVTALKGPKMGTFKLLVDSMVIGEPYDAFGATEESSGEIYFGLQGLTAGTHRFIFRVDGKNSAASDYDIGIDVVCLKQVTGD